MNSNFQDAQLYISGGVNSPVRAFKGLGIDPIFIQRGKSKYLFDTEGNRYTDFCCSWGALILGHAFDDVLKETISAIQCGTSFGAPTTRETELAKLICSLVPSSDLIRFVNSGTEAVMTAIRLARAFTGKNKVIKFDGCYHGHSDGLLVSAGSGVASLHQASSNGIPEALSQLTYSLQYNNISLFEQVLSKHHDSIAAVIIEPVPANMGLIVPDREYIHSIRTLTKKYNTVLIFDEVITGFRLGLGGAQEYLGVLPDLTCLGKIIGGGFPVGAVCGRKDIMNMLAPNGQVYQAGTLSGNPIAMTAGYETINYVKQHPEHYTKMESLVSSFAARWKASNSLTIANIGSMFTIFTTNNPVNNFTDSNLQDAEQFSHLYRTWLSRGIYMPPSRFETAFISIDHTQDDLNNLLITT